MNGFEIYKVYLAIKLHFTSKNRSYDFHRHGGRTTAKLETFTKRRDRYFFHKLSRTYNSTTVVDYFVSNFVNNTNLWVGDIIGSTGDESYKEIFEFDFNDNHLSKIDIQKIQLRKKNN